MRQTNAPGTILDVLCNRAEDLLWERGREEPIFIDDRFLSAIKFWDAHPSFGGCGETMRMLLQRLCPHSAPRPASARNVDIYGCCTEGFCGTDSKRVYFTAEHDAVIFALRFGIE